MKSLILLLAVSSTLVFNLGFSQNQIPTKSMVRSTHGLYLLPENASHGPVDIMVHFEYWFTRESAGERDRVNFGYRITNMAYSTQNGGYRFKYKGNIYRQAEVAATDGLQMQGFNAIRITGIHIKMTPIGLQNSKQFIMDNDFNSCYEIGFVDKNTDLDNLTIDFAHAYATDVFYDNHLELQNRLDNMNVIAQNRADYSKLIKQADEAFNTKKYSEAKSLYEQASRKLPREQYPNSQIEKVNKLLSEQQSQTSNTSSKDTQNNSISDDNYSTNSGNTNTQTSYNSGGNQSGIYIPSAEENMRQVGIDPNTDYMGNVSGLLGNMFAENQRRDQERAWAEEQRQNERDARAYENYQEERNLLSMRDQCFDDFNNGRYDNIYSSAIKGLASKNKKYEADFLVLAVLGGVLQKKYDEAINYGNKLKLHSRYGEVGVYDRFAVELYMGIAYHSLEKYEQSIASYANAKSLDDKSTLVNRLMGDVYFELKKYPEAVTAYTHELEITPFDILSLKGRAKAKSALKDYEGALSDYTLGIDNTAEKVSFYELRADLKRTKLMDYPEAISDYTKLIAIGNNKASYFSNRGKTYYSMNKSDSALVDITTAIQLNPNDNTYYYERALVYVYKIRDLNKALIDVDKALQLNPKSNAAYLLRARIYMRLDNYTKAAIDYNKLLETKPNDSNLNFYLGQLYYLYLNDTASANPYLKKVILKDTVSLRGTASLLYLGQKEKAFSKIDNAIAKETDPESKKSLIYSKVLMYAASKQEAKALLLLEELLKSGFKLDPYEAYHTDGFFYMRNKPNFKALVQKYYKP